MDSSWVYCRVLSIGAVLSLVSNLINLTFVLLQFGLYDELGLTDLDKIGGATLRIVCRVPITISRHL